MNLLLDTCTLIWLDGDDSSLSPTALKHITDINNHVFLSSISVWEIIHKQSIGKLRLWSKPDQVINKLEQDYLLNLIPFTPEDAITRDTLQMKHKDPFDLMLICQAQNRGLTLVTPDPAIKQYPVPVLW